MILKLIPNIGNEIEFNIIGHDYFYMGDIDLKEDQREEIILSDYNYITKKNKIVQVTFTIVILGDSKKDILDKVKKLQETLSTEGKLEYAPDNASSTFYSYLPSPPPQLIQDEKNSWENCNVNIPNGSNYANMFRITLNTKAIAKSEIRTLGTYTIGNGDFDIDLGSYDASELHLTMKNLNSNDTSEVILFTADEYEPILYAQDSSTEGSGWTVDTRTNGLSSLVRVFTPTSTSSVHIYWNAAIADYKNSLAIYLIAKTSSLNYKLKASLVVNNATLSNNIYHTPVYEDTYHLIYVGDIKYPTIEYTFSPKIDIEIKNEIDTNDIEIDGLLVVKQDAYTSRIVAEAANDEYIHMSDNRGVLYSDASFKSLIDEIHGELLLNTTSQHKTLYIVPSLEYGVGDMFGSVDGLEVEVQHKFNLIYPNEE